MAPSDLRGLRSRRAATHLRVGRRRLQADRFCGRGFRAGHRAVRCQGDIDHSGAVDAADIALLLGMWGCESSVCPIPAVDLNVDGDVNAKDLSLLLANWGPATCANAPCAPPQWPVPLDIATDAKSAVDFSIHFVGLTDIAGYRAWAATVPVPLREYVDEMIWQVVKREE